LVGFPRGDKPSDWPALRKSYVEDAAKDFGEHIIAHLSIVVAAIFGNFSMGILKGPENIRKINLVLFKVDCVFSVVPIEFHKAMMGRLKCIVNIFVYTFLSIR
jgi:membrane glycosyltransferase